MVVFFLVVLFVGCKKEINLDLLLVKDISIIVIWKVDVYGVCYNVVIYFVVYNKVDVNGVFYIFFFDENGNGELVIIYFGWLNNRY